MKVRFLMTLLLLVSLLVSSLPLQVYADGDGNSTNTPPIAVDDAYNVEKGGTLSIAAPGLLGNDRDTESNPLTAVRVTDPAHGMLTLNIDGSLTYVHDGSETVTDVFTYKANDGAAESNFATVTITVNQPSTGNLIFNFLDQNGDLAGTGQERVYVDGFGWKADGDSISLQVGQTIKHKAYFKEGSGLYGTQTTVAIDGSSATVPVMFHTLVMDFKDQNGDLNPTGGIGTGNERAYIDNVGYKTDGESVTVPLNSTIKYKAYFKEGSGLYGTQTTVAIDGSTATVPVIFHTLAMDFKDQNGDLNPAGGIGTGNERAYIDNVGYKTDGESVTVPLNSTIKHKAYFKEGSGLYGTQTTVAIDGSSATVPVMFHTLAMDFKDQNGDLNPATGIGTGNERAYIDNVGYKTDGESVAVPLNSTIKHKAYFKEGSGLYGTQTTLAIDGSTATVPVMFHTLAMDLKDQNGDLNLATGIGTGNERAYIDNVGYKADGESVAVPLNSTIKHKAYFKEGSGLYGTQTTLAIDGSAAIVPVMFHTLAMDFKDQNGDLNPATGIGTGNERAYIDNVGYKTDGESVAVPLNSTIKYKAYFKEGSGLYGTQTTLAIDGSTATVPVMFHTLAMDLKDQNGDLNLATGIGTGNERAYIDNVGYKADGESVAVPLNSTIKHKAYFKEGSGLYGPQVTVNVNEASSAVTVNFSSVIFQIINSTTQMPVTGAQAYVDNVGYVANGGKVIVPLGSTVQHKAKVGNVWSAKTGRLVDSSWAKCSYPWTGTAFGTTSYEAAATNYNLTIGSTEGGSVTVPGAGSFSYAQGTIVNITATPDTGYQFVEWTGDIGTIGDASSASTTITMDFDKKITATFVQNTYTLTVNTTGGGTVAKVPDQASYDSGTLVQLKATPEAGWRFKEWSEDLIGGTNPATITMDANKTITANFTLIPNPDLIASWSFDEGSGNTVDDSVGASDGTVIGAAWVPDGKLGSALRFDGLDNSIDFGDQDVWDLGTNPHSFEIWARFNSNQTGVFLSNHTAGGGGFSLSYDQTNGQIVYSNGTEQAVFLWTAPLDEWHQIILTKDSSAVRTFVDGEQIGEDQLPFAITASSTSLICRAGLNAEIDDLTIWNRALSASEVVGRYSTAPARDEISASVDPEQETTIISYSGEMTLTIPVGAVSEPAVIEVAERGSYGIPNQGILDRFDFNAHSVSDPSLEISQFNQPLTIAIQYDAEELFGYDADTLAFYSIDDQTGELTLDPTSQFDFATGMLTATINHFSAGASAAEKITNLAGGTSSFQVGMHSGAAISSYPIQVPPGAGGFQPDLTLTYDSNRVNQMKNTKSVGSWVGIGWQLHPGRISKIGKDAYLLEMNGISQKLVAAGNGQYHTDLETFSLITHGNQGDDPWYMIDRNGNSYRFGSGEASRQNYKDGFGTHHDVWYLDLMQASNTANQISITYNSFTEAKGVRSVWPVEMSYNGGNARIVFTSSGGRIDLPEKKEFQIEDRRLDSIETFVRNDSGQYVSVRKYDFAYQQQGPACDDCAGWLTLKSIEELGATGTSILRPTTFGYTPGCISAVDAIDDVDYMCCWPYLETLSTGYGGLTTFEYTRTPALPNMWELQIVTATSVDPDTSVLNNEMRTAYQYWGLNELPNAPWYIPYYKDDPWASEFRGYHRVVETDGDGNDIEHCFAIDLFCTGQERQATWYQGNVAGGSKVRQKLKTWKYITIECGDDQVTFPYLDSVEDHEYGSAPEQYSRVEYKYDVVETGTGYGNITTEYHYGGSETGDEFSIHRVFNPNPVANIVALPARERVYEGWISLDDGGINLRKETRLSYDNADWQTPPAVGNLTRTENSVVDGSIAVTQFAYDSHGNIISQTDPNGNITTLTYDPTGTFPTSMTSPLIGMEIYEYDSGTGSLKQETDVNAQMTTYQHDAWGRLTKVIEPMNNENSPTIGYLYHYGKDEGGNPIPLAQQYVETRTKDDSAEGYHWSRDYFDGLGRTIQTHEEADDGNTIVASTMKYERRGLVDQVFLPQAEVGIPAAYVAPTTMHSVNTYDAFGRVVTETAADGTSVGYDYSEPWVTKATNERGFYRKNYNDVFGQLVKVEEFGDPENPADKDSLYATTRYTYDVLGNLLKTTDNAGNETVMEYDRLGRKTKMTDPDMGTWHYGYDANGNLTWQIDAKGQATNFYYDELNRLKGKVYGQNASPIDYAPPGDPGYGGHLYNGYEVGFCYDDIEDGNNGIGRITGVFSPYTLPDSPPSGGGDEADYIEIRNVYDLQNMNLDLNANYKLMNDIDASVTATWNEDPACPGEYFGFDPIGDQDHPFTGTLDGRGFSIDSLMIHEIDYYCGLFAVLDGAQCSNLTLNNLSLKGYGEVGGLAGWIQGSTVVESVAVEGNLTTTGQSDAGMIVGGVEGDCRFTACTASGHLTAISNRNVGGFAGYTGSGEIIFAGCRADCSITANWSAVGGFIGNSYSNAQFFECEAGGEISGSGITAGGFAGYTYANEKFSDCNAAGDIDASGGDNVVGGFIGYTGNYEQMVSCSASGNIAVSGDGNNAGGFVGFTESHEQLTDCWSFGDVVAIGLGNTIGGFTGFTCGEEVYTRCSAFGSVSSSGVRSEAGGFAGFTCADTKMVNCYATGAVVLTGDNGWVGGFMGFEDGDSGALYQHCYATGRLENSGIGNVVNGFGARRFGDSLIDACFWDTEASGIVSSAVGIGRSTVEMKAESTFTTAGWDFDTVWDIDGITNDGYPYLRSMILPQNDISDLTATPGDKQVKLSWVNPSNTDFAGVAVVRSEAATPTGVLVNGITYTAGQAVGNGTVAYVGSGSDGTPGSASFWTDTGLTNGVHYHYKVFAYRSGPGYSQGKPVDAIAGRPQLEATRTFKYDARGRLEEEKLTVEGQTYTTGYGYDSADRLKTVTYPNQETETVTQTYSDRGLPNTLKSFNESVETNLVTGIQYNPLGQVSQINLGNGVQTAYGYYGFDPEAPAGSYGRLWRIRTASGGNDLQNITHAWDAGGNLTVRADNLKAQGEAFSYDFLDRLKTATVTGPSPYTRGYDYDKLGNITKVTVDGVPNDYSYNTSNKPHAVRSAFGKAYDYDANGNMTQRGDENPIGWDIENRPVYVVADYGDVQSTFAYDAFGDRLLKTELNADGEAETVLYVNDFYEKNLTTAEETSHYYLGGQEVAFRKSTETGSSTLEYLHTDHLGSTALITDANGAQVGDAMTYLPFGGTTGTVDTDKKFTGQRLDQTGLYFYNARYYDAEIGRFISADTIIPDPTNPQAFNRYSYVINNPMKYTDPSGHWFETAFDFISAGLSFDQFVKDPSLTNFGFLAFDVAAVFVPFLPASGTIRMMDKMDSANDVGRFAGNTNTVPMRDFKVISAAEANRGYPSKTAPYLKGSVVGDFETASNGRFIRFSREGSELEGSWLAHAADEEVLGVMNNPALLKQYLGLNFTPTHYQLVEVGSGVHMRVGRVGEQLTWNVPNPGGMQYQLMQGYDKKSVIWGEVRRLQ